MQTITRLQHTKSLLNILIPAFSATCIAAIFRHPSFDMLNKQDDLVC